MIPTKCFGKESYHPCSVFSQRLSGGQTNATFDATFDHLIQHLIQHSMQHLIQHCCIQCCVRLAILFLVLQHHPTMLRQHVQFVGCLTQHCCVDIICLLVVTNVATGWANERNNMLDQMLHPMLRSFGLRFRKTGQNSRQKGKRTIFRSQITFQFNAMQ